MDSVEQLSHSFKIPTVGGPGAHFISMFTAGVSLV